jgi:hypothetical protein
MTPDVFDEWLRRQGHRVFRTASSYWYDQGPRVFQAFPYHRLITPSAEELEQFLVRARAVGLRFSTPVDSDQGMISYHAVYEGPSYALTTLPRKARYDVRMGLEHFQIEPISFERMATEGWEVRSDTLRRQEREQAEEAGWWRRLCESAAGLQGLEAWGALAANRLAACLIAFTAEGCCSILYQQSRSECLAQGVNNALTYGFTQAALARDGVRSIFYGLQSLDAPPSVDAFKFRMGYQAKPVRQRVVFHPVLRPLFNGGSRAALRLARRLRPHSAFLARAEGMLRLYFEGKQPLARQPWPEALADRRQAMLAEHSPLP